MTKATKMIAAVMAVVAGIAWVRECQSFSPIAMPRSLVVNPNSGIAASRNSSLLRLVPNTAFLRLWRKTASNPVTTRRMAAMSDEAAFRSNDPFLILGLEGPTADKKVIKRAYKKRALKFHPDVVTDIHSSPEEKKWASDRFSKINGAYEQLMGKGMGNGSSNNNNDASSSSTDGWTPPHRRSSGYKSSSSSSSNNSEGASTDWRDYMPNYEKDENYDTGGDSFGQIFSDLFTGAAGAAVSSGIGGMSGGIFNEFLEFLEGNGVATGGGDDADLRELLRTATLEEISEEMDDTELVVNQLETKSRGLEDEIFAMDAEAQMAARFSERITLEEKGDELKARKNIVNGYLDRSRKRLLSLQERYKELRTYGRSSPRDDDYSTGSRSQSSWQDVRDEASTQRQSSSSYSSSSRSSSSSYDSTRTEPSNTEAASETKSDSDNSWMNEGFGSGGRSRGRRGSGRRRAARNTSTSSSAEPNPSRSAPSPSYSTSPPSPAPAPAPSPSYSTTSSGSSNSASARSPSPPPRTSSSSSSAVEKSPNYDYVPPHRRTTGSSYASRQEEDRKRMQEIKIDEEFDKLKKELGL